MLVKLMGTSDALFCRPVCFLLKLPLPDNPVGLFTVELLARSRDDFYKFLVDIDYPSPTIFAVFLP